MLDTIKPTDEQSSVISLVKGTDENIQVRSYAGTGKTTTLDFIQANSPIKPVLCLAFNKSVAVEAEKRFLSTTTVRTFNSLGHRVWAKTVGKVSFDTSKMKNILKEELNGLKGDDRKAASEAYWEIVGGVSLAKSLGYVPEGKYPVAKRLMDRKQFHSALDEIPSPLIASLIDSVLLTSIKASYSGLIDYNDQIYMSALFGGAFPRFPFVIVDEYQDLSPTNHAMLDKLVKGRIAAVGDDFQCIYGFRGVESQGGERLRAKFSMTPRDLSISFRCPQAIVEAARWRVPNFKWSKPGGLYGRLLNPTPNSFPDNSAIICRNNAPLFKLAFGLLTAKRSVQVAGSDIGPRIIRLLQKLGDSEDSQAQVLGAISEWREAKLAASQAPGTINDMADCMRVFASYGSTLGQAVAYAQHLFDQQGTIRLLTGHKAKGLEWDHVFHLDPWLIKDNEQELNLRYVITTRSANTLHEINSKEMQW